MLLFGFSFKKKSSLSSLCAGILLLVGYLFHLVKGFIQNLSWVFLTDGITQNAFVLSWDGLKRLGSDVCTLHVSLPSVALPQGVNNSCFVFAVQ